MPGIKDLRRIQLGVEIYGYGTPVTPTAQLVGGLDAIENRFRIFTSEASGVMSAHRRAYDQAIQAELAFDAGDEGATFEQIINFLSMALIGGVVPVPVGAAGYAWTFTPNLGAGNVPDIFTMRYGDNQRCWESEGVFATELALSAAFQEGWRLTSALIGDQMGEGATFAPGITYPTPLETVLAQMTRLYIDDTWATLGTTPITGTLIDWGWTLPAFHPKFFQDGQLTYSDIGLASRALALELTFEFNAQAVAERLLWMARTPRFIRLEATGGVINAGVPPDLKTVRLDMCVVYEGTDPLDERDGNDTMRFTGRSVNDGTAQPGHEFQVMVLNTIDALP